MARATQFQSAGETIMRLCQWCKTVEISINGVTLCPHCDTICQGGPFCAKCAQVRRAEPKPLEGPYQAGSNDPRYDV